MYYKVAIINNTEKELYFDFKYTEIKDASINIYNINKSDLLSKYDFILIFEKDE